MEDKPIEPGVRVVLFSDLFGCFAGAGRADPENAAFYGRLLEAGLEVVFVSGAPVDTAAGALAHLAPRPAVVCAGGEFSAAADHPAALALGSTPVKRRSQRRAVADILRYLRKDGDIVIPFGIGDSADDDFLLEVELGALVPGADGIVCPLVPAPPVSHRCSAAGTAAWREWAQLLMKKFELLNARD